MKTISKPNQLLPLCMALVLLTSCGTKQQNQDISNDIADLALLQGELALCGTADFGTTNFALTCMKEVREEFELAVALLHSFEYEEAEKAFAKVIKADPECAIAYWGVAMSNYHPLWAPPKKDALEKSAKAIKLAQSIPTKTERESQYINAIAVYYQDWDQLDHKARAKRYVEAAEKLYTDKPDDKEAAIFYALALNSVVDPSDKNFFNQKKAGQILDALFPEQPDHPGIAHYLIHNYDYPELAHLALNSARRYAEIAPSSTHAQHMPSHIFTRLGLWEESIQSNLKSAEAARCYTEQLGKKGHWSHELHAVDYLVYAYLQSSQLDEVKQLVEYTESIEEIFPQDPIQAYSMAAIPARYALELKNWETAANLPRLMKNFPWDNSPWEASIVNFARVLGAVHQNNPDIATDELQKLKANHQKLVDMEDDYKANQVNIQIKASEAWIRYGEGNVDEALKLMAEAADMEDNTAKHPVTPGEVLPARELLGDLYMKLEEYDKALVAYKLSLESHQNRFNSLYGAGLAAEKTGDTGESEKYFTLLASNTTKASGTRPELEYARKFVENKTGKQLSLK